MPRLDVWIFASCKPIYRNSMPLKFYAGAAGGLSTRAAVVLEEKGIPFEWVSVNPVAGETKSPEHLKRHPFGQLPVIVSVSWLLFDL
jgi:glutathione S-transferase